MPYLSPFEPLTLANLAGLLHSPEAVRLSPEAMQQLEATSLPPASPLPTEPAQGSAGLLLAYAAGTGPEVPAALVRRMLLLQAHRLGQSTGPAVVAVVRRLLDFYNRDVWPVVYEQGSLGAGGDQIPLAHLCLPLLGMGEVNYQGYRLAAADVLGLFGWEPPAPGTQEVLNLLAGSEFALAYATEAVERAAHLLRAAATIGSLAIEATGQDLAASEAAPLIPTSSHRALAAAQQAVEAECNTANRPVLALAEEPPVAVGPAAALTLAAALDHLARVMAEVGDLSARRTARLVAEPTRYPELRALPQAAASLASQNCQLGAVASPLPSELTALDGRATAAPNARRVVENVELILGIELLAATQALDLHRPAHPSAALERVATAFREHVTFVAPARVLTPDLHRAARFVREYAWA